MDNCNFAGNGVYCPWHNKVHYEKGEKFYSNDAPVEEGTYSMVVSLVNDSDGTLVRPWWCTFTITKD